MYFIVGKNIDSYGDLLSYIVSDGDNIATAKLTPAAKSKIDSIKKKYKGAQRLSGIYWVLRNYDLTSSDGMFIGARQLVNMAVYYAGLSGKIPYLEHINGNYDTNIGHLTVSDIFM